MDAPATFGYGSDVWAARAERLEDAAGCTAPRSSGGSKAPRRVIYAPQRARFGPPRRSYGACCGRFGRFYSLNFIYTTPKRVLCTGKRNCGVLSQLFALFGAFGRFWCASASNCTAGRAKYHRNAPLRYVDRWWGFDFISEFAASIRWQAAAV